MAYARWQATITDKVGNIVPNAQVEVRQEIAGSPLARLYSDRQGTVPAANPITGDANGYVYFHVTGGAYRITATKGGFSREWRYVGIGRNSESDLAGLRPQGAWDADLSYSGSDYIRHNGRTFVSLVDENVGNEPPDAPADSEVWMWVPLGENAELAIEAREEAEGHAGHAAEWAQSPDPISAPAGGDGATDRSSKWHADRSGAEADRAAGALDMVSGLASAFIIGENTFATKATAEAWHPVAAPDYIRTAGYTTAGDSGAALYNRVGSEPSHDGKFSITLSDGVTVVWYELADAARDCRAYGAKCDGVTNDSAAVLRQYRHIGKIILPPDTTTVLSSWATQSPTRHVSVLGERSVIKGLNASLFTLQNGSGIEVRGVTFDTPAAPIVSMNSAANLDRFYWIEGGITGGFGITPANVGGCLDIKHVRVENAVFKGLSADLLTLKSNIKKADIHKNIIDGITTTGNSAQAFLLGKTQLADQPNTGHYFCSGNKVTNLVAQGTGAGEVHAFLLYGTRAVVTGNIIADLSRTGVGANQEGIEGIYTKVRDVVITDNVLIRAGKDSGNKNAAITHKGVPLNSEAIYATEPEGAYFVIANNTIVGSASAAESGIRCEGDHGIIANNQIALCFYAINLSVGANVENVKITGNNCNQCTGPGGIRANVVCDALTISDNLVEKATAPIFTDSGGEAIAVFTNTRSGDVKHLNISDNQMLGAWEYGVRTQFVAPSICYDFHEQGNQIIGAVYGLRNYPDAQINNGYVVGNLMRAAAAYRDKSTKLVYNGNYNNGAAAP